MAPLGIFASCDAGYAYPLLGRRVVLVVRRLGSRRPLGAWPHLPWWPRASRTRRAPACTATRSRFTRRGATLTHLTSPDGACRCAACSRGPCPVPNRPGRRDPGRLTGRLRRPASAYPGHPASGSLRTCSPLLRNRVWAFLS